MATQTQRDGINAARAFIDAFNLQDHEMLAATLNYPHIRLANDRFMTVDSAEDFSAISRRGASRLTDEGWHHTNIRSIEAIHAGESKVHVAMQIDRCHADDSVYSSFETFWIATRVDGHWGIQFRSSFLR